MNAPATGYPHAASAPPAAPPTTAPTHPVYQAFPEETFATAVPTKETIAPIAAPATTFQNSPCSSILLIGLLPQ